MTGGPGDWPLPVASFWAGAPLSFVEQMTIRSYQAAGAPFTLYLAHPVEGVPAGVETRPVSDILPVPDFIGPDPDRKALAVWSDLFRVALLRQRGVIWVDLDAVGIRPFTLRGGIIAGFSPERKVLSGVLALPADCPALAEMERFLGSGDLAPPWADPDWIARRRRQRGTLGPLDLPWGDTGPRLLQHALERAGLMAHVAAPPVHYPVFRHSLPAIWTPGADDAAIVTPQTESVHVFGFTKRFLFSRCGGVPPDGSWLQRMAHRLGIDPAAAPARGEPLD